MKISAYIDGIGLLGPGLNGWVASQAVLLEPQTYQPGKTVLPPPTLLPAAERRRCGAIVKLVLATGLEAIAASRQKASQLPSVFASSSGDGDNCHVICETLASDDRAISPTRFHNSTHNAAAGYWGIATGAMTTASVLSAYDASFGAGLLEAVTQVVVDQMPTVLLACDTPYPEPLQSVRPLSDAFGIALVLAPQRSEQTLAHISVELTDAPAHTLDHSALENLRSGIPAARGLPLLQTIALHKNATVILDYLDCSRLAVTVTPC
ncbi:MAG: beta-ketoacyl synthase chain length factor [Pseudomonadota bacterium]